METMHPTAARRRGVEAIKRGLSETVVYAAEVDYNQAVVHKTARQRYYCHLNADSPPPGERERESPPSHGLGPDDDGARGRLKKRKKERKRGERPGN